MVESNVVSFGHNRLEEIGQRISKGHERLTKGNADWVEGTIEVAIALRDGRDAMPADISFGGWLRQNHLDFFSHQDRSALINLAADVELARAVLRESESRSYQHIWANHKERFTQVSKPDSEPSVPSRASQRRRRVPGRVQNFREMKLGEDLISKVKGTSLDNAAELDELVILNRGAPKGEHTEVVLRLVEAATKGENVSAIAEGVAMGGRRSKESLQLMANWKRRMIAAWSVADSNQRFELVQLLFSELDEEHQRRLRLQLVK